MTAASPDEIKASLIQSLITAGQHDLEEQTHIAIHGPGYGHYGMTTPILRREILGPLRKPLQSLEHPQRLRLAEELHASGFGEQAVAGNFILSLSVDLFSPEDLPFLDRCADHFRNWGPTDDFCTSVTGPILRRLTEASLAQLRQWNISTNRWKKRASVVTFSRSVGESGRFTEPCLELCENLIWDRDDLVRKGVGWTLKDLMRGDKKPVLDYVKGLRARGVSSVITLYAIRDLKGAERQAVLEIKASE